MPLQHNGPAPYSPAPAVTTVIERARNGSLPTPVDVGVLARIGVSDSLAPRTIATLKLLELIENEGQPTPTLDKLRVAKSDEYKEALIKWLRDVYREIFGIVDPATASYSDVEDAFRGHTPTGQRVRMVTLFIGLCDFAGLVPADSSLRGSVRTAKGGNVKKTVQKVRERRAREADGTGDGAQSTPAKTTQRMSKAEMLQELNAPPGLHPFIQGLVQTLPPVGTAWSPEKRQAWLNAASAAFQVIYEVPPDERDGVSS